MTAGSPIWNKVESIFSTECRLSLGATGGGVQLLAWLLNHPGASGCVVEAQIPYHEGALRDYLAAPGPHGSNRRTARDISLRAFARGAEICGSADHVIGFGCSAALATNRARRGEDRAFVAVRRGGEIRWSRLRFTGESGRLEQEEALSTYSLELLCEACGLPATHRLELPAFVEVEAKKAATDDPIDLLLTGQIDVLEIGTDGTPRIEFERRDRLLFPGSFNPLHDGHMQLAEAAQRQSGRPASMEISVVNVDKPELARAELERRLEQMKGKYPTILSRSPRFLEKAGAFEGCHFALGIDTALRLVEAKYYDHGDRGLAEALSFMSASGCRFFVAGRSSGGRWRTLDDLEIPAEFAGMFEAIPAASFRSELSSTGLRQKRPEADRGPVERRPSGSAGRPNLL